MRWLLSLCVFGMIVAGFFHTSLAAGDGHGNHGAHKDIGVHQPVADRSKGTIPAQVTLTQPKALAKVSGTSVQLKWERLEAATVYHVQVAKDPRFMWLITENHNVNGESFEVSGLESGKQYFWRVAARRPENQAGTTKGVFTQSSFEVQ